MPADVRVGGGHSGRDAAFFGYLQDCWANRGALRLRCQLLVARLLQGSAGLDYDKLPSLTAIGYMVGMQSEALYTT